MCGYIEYMKIRSAEFKKGVRGSDPILEDGLRQVAFVGRSNVGKSSVINSLVERKQLVKSSSSPGKTTEINFFLINDEVYLVDLPGYGYARRGAVQREKLRKMILWYLFSLNVPHRKIVLIIDAKVGITDFDTEILTALHDKGTDEVILVLNKFDKIKKNDSIKRTSEIEEDAMGYPIVPYSAKTKMGREELLIKIM